MSESLEIVEITDSSIITDTTPELKDSLQNATKTKRQLDTSDELFDEQPLKKICTELEDSTQVEIEESVIENTIIVNESKVAEYDNETVAPLDVLDKSDDLLIESVVELIDETAAVEPSDQEKDDNEEEEIEESFDNQEEAEEEEEENSSNDDDYDESLMTRALQASGKLSEPANLYQMDDDGTIALDDSDDEPSQRKEAVRKDSENSSEYSVNNDVIAESDDSDEEKNELEALRKKQLVKPYVQIARKLVKKSLKFLALRNLEGRRSTEHPNIEKNETEVKESIPESSIANTVSVPSSGINNSDKNEKNSIAAPKIDNSEEQMDTSENVVEKDLPVKEILVVTEKKKQTENLKIDEPPRQKEDKDEVSSEKADEVSSEKADEAEKLTDKPFDNSSDSSRHESSLLAEIANASTEEIFNRYVVKAADQSPSLDEFSEELFYCLQLNNVEIEKAKQLWNEKLHMKYKIRELMETIRRHRAVMEIEAFGYKPETSGSTSRPVVSSKSSTTNSETDNYEKHSRMTSESVSRLIQDVRASMIKRDDKLRSEELASGSTGEGTLASQWNSLQSSTGRQGQIVDVQSIINDFRQKNPQEIPRRGRRMKNTFDNNFFESQQDNLRKEFLSNVNNNSNDSSIKTNSGYPEVSLHPVQNLYKNLSNASGTSNLGIQRSSLLQSILTKQSTKSPSGFLQNQQLPSTSTLARLLTAPERSFQGAPKHTSQPPPRQSSTKSHNNGEITITPIGVNNSRSKEYAMEEDENSLEPPLIIDEPEDFDSIERSNVKSVSDLLCQGCKKNKAFFMCAGCSRQWYCSKDCQEIAWDDHAESCMI